MRRNLILALVILLAAAVFTACGASPKRDSAAPMATSAASNSAKAQEASAPAPAGAPGPVVLDRKIIKNANFDVKIKDGDETVNKISAAVTAAGGYVQDVKQSGTKQQGRTINMTVRVPASQYEALTDLIRSFGEITSQHQWTDDVTEQYVDLDERIKSKETHLNELQKLYTQAGSMKEMQDLATEIDRVTADLESMKGRMRVLSSQIDFSTIVVNLYEPGVPAPLEPPKTVWERMTRGFTESWHGVVNFTGDLAVFLVSALPILVYLALLGGIIYLLVRLGMRLAARWRAKHPLPPPPAYQPPMPYQPPLPTYVPQDPNQNQNPNPNKPNEQK